MDNLGNALVNSAAIAKNDGNAYDAVSRPQGDSPGPRAGWRPFTCVAFRIAFIYFLGFIWLYGSDSIFHNGYLAGGWISDLLNWPLNHAAVWAGSHVFHLGGIPPNWHVTHRGDGSINWVLDKLLIAGAVIGGLAWTAIAKLRGSRRTEYCTLLAWLRFLLRLTAAFFMIGYGMVKVFPQQMGPIPMAVLNQPVGQMSPHALLWSMVGLYPLYESICGIAEVLGGALMLFRRTALMGALFSIFVMSNVVLYNFFFDVSVKLFALNLLLVEVFLVLPDAKTLFDFFWQHKRTAQTGVWAPPAGRRAVRLYVRTLEIVFIAASLIVIPWCNAVIWHHERLLARVKSPLVGAWRLDSTSPATGPFSTPAGPVDELYIDAVDSVVRRSTNGVLWRTDLRVNPAAHTVLIRPAAGDPVTYAWRMPDVNHLVLTAREPGTPGISPAFVPKVLTLTRVPTPVHYRLFDRRFQFVTEEPTEQ